MSKSLPAPLTMKTASGGRRRAIMRVLVNVYLGGVSQPQYGALASQYG